MILVHTKYVIILRDVQLPLMGMDKTNLIGRQRRCARSQGHSHSDTYPDLSVAAYFLRGELLLLPLLYFFTVATGVTNML